MADLAITLLAAGEGRLRVRCEHEGRVAEAETALPAAERAEELWAQVRAGDAPAVAQRDLADMLGAVLFAGEAGRALRDALLDDPQRTVALAAPPPLSRWPWELAREPLTGRYFVLDGAALVRVAGEPARRPRLPARAVLVVPAEVGASHLQALQAATRHLAHKAGLDVYPAEPATGPSLRRTLGRGAAFVHLEAPIAGEEVRVDDGRLPVDRIGLDPDTWLVVLGGTDAGAEAAARLRGAGVPVVVALQTALRPELAATVNRELYRALARGAGVLEAVERVRAALARKAGPDAFVWAAPVVWAAPGAGEDATPASLPVPPAAMTDAPSARGTVPSAEPIAASPYPDLAGPSQRPIPSPVFLHETLRLVRERAAHADPETEARVQTLRALGARAGGIEANDGGDDPGVRTARLADRLVEAISRHDGPLAAPAELTARLASAAHAAALAAEPLRRAATALLASRVVLLVGPGAERARAARYLAEEVFDYHARVARIDGASLMTGPEGRDERGASVGGGWLFEAVTANWRRDELDPLHPDQPPPAHRLPLVGRAGGAWRIYEGAWLVVRDAHRAKGAELVDLIGSVDDGVLQGFAGGRPYRAPVPADFRVILTASTVPEALPEHVPVVAIRPSTDLAAERERWIAVAEAQAGPAPDAARTLARTRAAQAIAEVVRFARIARPLSGDVGAAALTYALRSEGSLEAAVDEALCVYLFPRLASGAPDAIPLLVAYLDGEEEAIFGCARQLVAGSGGSIERATAVCLSLAEYLDATAPTEASSRTAAVAEAIARGPDGGRRLAPLVDAWKASGGIRRPDIPLPRLRRALLTGPVIR